MTAPQSRVQSPVFDFVASATMLLSSAVAWTYSQFGLASLLYVASLLVILCSDLWRQRLISYRFALLWPYILYAATPITHIGLGGNSYGLTEPVFLPLIVGSWAFFAILYFGLPRQTELVEMLQLNQTLVARSKVENRFLFVLMALLFYAYVYTTASSVEELSRGERISGQSLVQTLAELGLVAAVMLSFCLAVLSPSRHWAIPIAFATVYLLIEIFYFADRRTALSLFVAMNVVALASGRFRFKIWYLIPIVALMPLLLVFGVLRAFPVSDWPYLISSGFAFRDFSLMRTELGASAMVANVVGSTTGVLTFEPSYHLVVPQLIPSSLVSRSEWLWSPSQKYAYVYGFESFQKGGAFGYNIILESFQNFYIAGPLVLGLFLVGVYKGIVRLSTPLRLYFIACFSFATAFIYRMDLVSWLQNCFYLCLLGLLFWSGVQMLLPRVRHWGPTGSGPDVRRV